MGRLTEDNKAFIREHPDMMVKDLAELFHCDRHTISRYKKKIGIAFTQTHDFHQYDNYIIENYDKKTSKTLAAEIGCSSSYVIKIWNENNCKGKTTYRYYCNYAFFQESITADHAYILGLLASDGNLYKRDNHEGQIQITLHKQDIDILEKIKKRLESEHPIKIGRTKESATITIVSDIMYNDLIKIGLEQRKTWHLKIDQILNNIPQQYWKDFLRGYFDGDGCITGKDRPSNFAISFAVPENIKDSFLKLIKTLTQEDFCYVEDKRQEKYTFPFGAITAKNTIQKYLLLQLFYYDSPTLYLNRKQEKASQLIRQIENNTTNRSENKIAVIKWGELLENLKWQSAAEP